MEQEQNNSLAIDRAERIKRLRRNLRYSRQKFSDKYKKLGITASALQSWEDIRWNGLTEKGAHLLAQAFQEEGLQVTVQWLLFGIGEDPLGNIAFPLDMPLLHTLIKPSEKNNIAKELRLFHQHITEGIDTVITDDGLAPWLAPGDYVAGKRYFDNDIEKAIGSPCIVQTLAGETLVRMLTSGSDLELYTLACSNPVSTNTQRIIEDIRLFSAAPILWIRKMVKA